MRTLKITQPNKPSVFKSLLVHSWNKSNKLSIADLRNLARFGCHGRLTKEAEAYYANGCHQ